MLPVLASFDGPVFLAACAGLGSAFLWGLGCLMFDRVQARPPSGVGEGVAPPSAAGMNLFKNSLCGLVMAVVLGVGMLATGGSGGELALPSGGAFWMLALTGVVGFAVGDSLYFAAFPKAGVRVTAMVGTLIPVLAGLMSWLFLDRSFGAATWVWMAVVLAGISMVVLDPVGRPSEEAGGSGRDRMVGLGLALGSALSQAVGIVLAFGAFEGVGVVPGTLSRLVGGIVAALVIGAGAGLLPGARGALAEVAELVRPLRTPALWRMLVPPTIVATILSLPLHSAATRGAPPQISALVLACSPLFILPLGRFFGARHGLLSVVGTLIGLVGVAGVLRLTMPG